KNFKRPARAGKFEKIIQIVLHHAILTRGTFEYTRRYTENRVELPAHSVLARRRFRARPESDPLCRVHCGWLNLKPRHQSSGLQRAVCAYRLSSLQYDPPRLRLEHSRV